MQAASLNPHDEQEHLTLCDKRINKTKGGTEVMGLLEYIKDEAREEGKLEGILKSKHETAKKMLTSGVEIKLISNFTNLSTKEIQKIKREMDKK